MINDLFDLVFRTPWPWIVRNHCVLQEIEAWWRLRQRHIHGRKPRKGGTGRGLTSPRHRGS